MLVTANNRALGRMEGNGGSPSVGVVIPTYNEERNLPRLLKSIQAQTAIQAEVVVVDQSSSDQTVDIARQHGAKVVQTPRPPFYSPPGASRNLGAQSVSGDILLHLDADMELPSPNFLKQLVGLLDDSHEALIIHEVDVATGFWNQCKSLERRCYWGTEMESARAVTRRLFNRVGGYRSYVASGEDMYLNSLYERETVIAADDSLLLLHNTGRTSLWRLLRKKFQYGRTARNYLKEASAERPEPGRRMVVLCLSAYLTNWRLLFSDPVHYLGIFPLRGLEFIAVSLGMVAGRD